MFRQLRLKLTLINVIVMALLCFLLVTGTYFIMQFQIFNQSQQLMQIIASEAGSGNIADSFKHNRHVLKYFYAKTDPSGNITESSPDTPLSSEQLSQLVQKALNRKDPRGEVELQDISYTFLKVPLAQTPGLIFVFVNLERDREILRFLLGTLVVGGLIYLGLAFYGGLFLADRALRPIRQSWQRQQDFVADASHELRTPLTIIQTNLELIQSNPEETVASQAKWLENLQIETKRMAKLVEDLLFLARADSQTQLLEMRWFPLDVSLRSAFASFEVLAARQNIQLESVLENQVMFYGDENKIKQLLVALVDNALKHTPSGGCIKLGLQSLGSSVNITVSDTGEGIEPEHLEKIFQRFYRVDKARSKQTGGTGLGLAIADWIVRSHRGTIKVTSMPGKGTTFTVTLPKSQ